MPKVFLSAGHGGNDPGAVAYGLKEKDINLAVLKSCRDVLKQHNVTVVCSRETDENDPVGQEVKEANEADVDIAASFHINAGKGDGFEAFCNPNNKDGMKLAKLGEKYIKELGQNSRGIKNGMHLCFIKNTKKMAVLFETFFIDNDKDNNIGDTAAEQKKIGIAYAKAILEYFGIKYEPEAKKTYVYYKKYTGTSTKVDEVFKAIGVPEKYRGSYKKRKPIATKNGIKAYVGLANQNSKMVKLAKQGKLKKA
jgi:N-acetylmuramoyl-L-alanine amidase